ncbi:peptidase S10 [Croceicoccus sp. Ery5]|uniref:S10 family serine carboxypeptidase-like protein n=1 Tax=Croceicoccus sp. Ery5 TaxID=1703340 RepID=UPI001E397F7B|nr:peptidase S10 [Croceicoccus sp. Ery5]
MKSIVWLTLSALAPLLGACAHVPPPVAACPGDAIATQHSVKAGDDTLSYRACAGTLPVDDASGTNQADLFYTAYFLDRSDAGRPIAFVWNGGPGADSRLLHFHAMGPKVLKGGALVDNPVTPLVSADLVFLDPAGTGFSRAAGKDAGKALYGTMGDIAATARFVTQFREAAGRQASPLYLAGESFGTWRAAGTADLLAGSGVEIAGIALISGGIPQGDAPERALMRALSLPNRTATALALGRLPADLQAMGDKAVAMAEKWALESWYPALADPASLPAVRRQQVARDLARFHGLDEAQVDAESLWISPRDFRQKLLADKGKTLGIFDMRQTDAGADEAQADAAIIAYYREVLGYRSGEYAGIEVPAIPVGAQWQYDQAPVTEESLARAMAGEGPPSPSQPWVAQLLARSPDTRVLVATGLYDSLGSCAANRAAAAAFGPQWHGSFVLRCYRGGHMMYEEASQAPLFGRDLTAFFGNSPLPPQTGN